MACSVEIELGYVRNILPANYAVPFFGQEIDTLGAEPRASQPMLCTIDQECFCGSSQPVLGTYEREAQFVVPKFSMSERPDGRDRAFSYAQAHTRGFRLHDHEVGFDCGCVVGTASLNLYNGNLVLSISLPGGTPADPPIRLYYNSLAAHVDSPYGRGWSFLYDQAIEQGLNDLSSSSSNSGSSEYLRKLISVAGLEWRIERDDVAGCVTRIHSPSGRITTLEYAGSKLSRIVDGWGRSTPVEIDPVSGLVAKIGTTSFSYNNELQLWQVENAAEKITEFTYDHCFRIKSIRLPKGETTRFKYKDGEVRSRIITNAMGHKTTLTLDAEGNVHVAQEPVGITTTYTWDSYQRLVSFQDGRGNTTTLSYDAMTDLSRRLRSIRRPIGGVTFTYDEPTGRLLSITEARGPSLNSVTTLQWAYIVEEPPRPPGVVTTITNALGKTYQYTYTVAGQLSRAEDPLSNEISWQHDSQEYRRTSTTLGIPPLVERTTYVYDNAPCVTSVVKALGGLTTITRDSSNRIKTLTDPNSDVTTMLYDPTGRLLDRVDPSKGVWRWFYTDNGWLEQTADAARGYASYEHNKIGALIKYINEQDFATHRTYDQAGRLESIRNAEGETSTYTYDAAGNILTEINPLGVTRTYTYDANNRLETEAAPLPLGPRTTYAYDHAGNMTAVTNADSKVATSVYDAEMQRVAEIDQLSHTTTYTYDDAGNLISVTDPLSHVTTYVYNAINRLVNVVNANGFTLTHAYDAAGRLTTITDEEGNVAVMGYDPGGRLVRSVDARGNVTTHSYDTLKRQHITQAPSVGDVSRVSTTTYDPAGRVQLVELNGDDFLAFTPNRTYYGYYPDGLLHYIRQGESNPAFTTYVYDKAGRLKEVMAPQGVVTEFSYDAAGRRTAVTNALGHTTSFMYDTADRLTTVVTSEGYITTYAYDVIDRMTTLTNGRGYATGYAYDAANRRTVITDALGNKVTHVYYNDGRLQNVVDTADSGTRTWTFEYDGVGNVTTITSPLGHENAYTYYRNNWKKTHTDPRSLVTTFTYYANGLVQQEERPNDCVTAHAYDNLNRLLSITDGEDNVTTYAYDPNWDGIAEITNARGFTTRHEYDTRGNLFRTHVPVHRPGDSPVTMTTEFLYDGASRLTTITSSSPAATSASATTTVIVELRQYDLAGRLTTLTNSEGTTSFAFDEDGRQISKTTPLGNTTLYSYDGANNLVTERSPMGSGYVTTYAYDAVNQQTRVTNPEGRYTDVVYDEAGRIISKSDRAGHTTTYTYDEDDRLVEIEDAENQTTTFEYDDAGNQISIEYASGEGVTQTYDENNRLSTKIEYASGGGVARITLYAYDKVNRPVNRYIDTFPPTISEIHTTVYDEVGNITEDSTLTDLATDSVTEYSYDAANRIYKESRSVVDSVATLTYNPAGYLIHRTYKIGAGTEQVATLSYTDAGRPYVSQITGLTATLSYDADGRAVLDERPKTISNEGIYYEYDYNPAGWVTTITANAYGAGALATTTFSYDKTGKCTHRSGTSSGTFTYDSSGRVRFESKVSTQLSWYGLTVNQWDALTVNQWDALIVVEPVYSSTFTYDKMANVLTVATAGSSTVTATYSSNRIATRNDGSGTVTYVYDDLRQRVSRTASSGATTYTWNFSGQLIGVDGPAGHVTLTYDSGSLLQTREAQPATGSSETNHYIWIGNNLVAETDGSGNIVRRYNRGASGYGQLSAYYDSDSDVVAVPFAPLGGTVSSTSVGESVEQQITVGAYGEVAAISSALNGPDREGVQALNAGFGVFRDSLTGLYYMRHRWYDPETKQFLTPDPIGEEYGGPNPYAFAGADPVNQADPEGLDYLVYDRVSNSTGSFPSVVSWVIEKQDGVVRVLIGKQVGDQIKLLEVMGGGSLPADVVRAAVESIRGNGYDMSTWPTYKHQVDNIRAVFDRIKKGGKVDETTARQSVISAIGDGARLGLYTFADAITLELVGSLHRSVEQDWVDSGMDGTWTHVGSKLCADIASQCFVTALTLGAGQALTAAKAGAVATGAAGSTQAGIAAARGVAPRLVTGLAPVASGTARTVAVSAARGVNYLGRAYDVVSTVKGVGEGIQMVRDGNPWGWLAIAGVGVSGVGNLSALRSGLRSTARTGSRGGRGLIGYVKAGGEVDDSLREVYLKIAQSPKFAADVARYNRIAGRLGLTKSKSVDEVMDALRTNTTFAKTRNVWAGIFVPGQHSGPTRFWIQGNPGSSYGRRAGRHELVHLGAALGGQRDRYLHEFAVQAATTPENLVAAAGVVGAAAGVGVYLYYNPW